MDEFTASEAPVIEGGAPAVESDQVPATSEQPAERSYLPDDFRQSYVKVKVGGAEEDVSLEEALAGYQRQADYTKKTQEIAAQRKALAQYEGLISALEADPVGTVRALTEAYGVNTQADPDEDDFLDPMEARLRDLERQLEAQSRVTQQKQLESELASIRSTYADEGIEYQDEELLSFALQRQIPDLDAAFRAFAYERVLAEAKTAKAERARLEEQARTAAKRAAGVVEGGHSPAAGSVTPGQSAKPKDIREAWRMAKAQLGQ